VGCHSFFRSNVWTILFSSIYVIYHWIMLCDWLSACETDFEIFGLCFWPHWNKKMFIFRSLKEIFKFIKCVGIDPNVPINIPPAFVSHN
jgi:hypothetical protein